MHFCPSLRSGCLAALLALGSVLTLSAEDATTEATQPAAKERPKLSQTDLLGEANRIEIHGGASFTIGGGSGTSFREYAGWATFHDPDTGITLGVGYAKSSGNGPRYGYLGDYYDDYGYGYGSYSGGRTLYGSQYSSRGRFHPGYGRWDGQTTDVMLQLPLLGNRNFLTVNVSKETIRSGN